MTDTTTNGAINIRKPYLGYCKPLILIPTDFRMPETFSEWKDCLWNFDIFIGPIPFLKSLVAANTLVWFAFAFALWRTGCIF